MHATVLYKIIFLLKIIQIIASSVMNVIGSMMAILLMIISLISLGDTNQHCPPKSYYGAANYTQCVVSKILFFVIAFIL